MPGHPQPPGSLSTPPSQVNAGGLSSLGNLLSPESAGGAAGVTRPLSDPGMLDSPIEYQDRRVIIRGDLSALDLKRTEDLEVSGKDECFGSGEWGVSARFLLSFLLGV